MATGRCKFIPFPDEPANPLAIGRMTGLDKFWRLFSRAITISPSSGGDILMPEVSMITEIGGELNMDRGVFWDCVYISLARIKSNHLTKFIEARKRK